jgi:hypothetical protein
VGELRRGRHGLCSREAAGVDQVVLGGDGDFGMRGNGRRSGGDEAAESGDGRGGWGREDMGSDA